MTCLPITIPYTRNRSRIPQLRTYELLIPPLRTSNLRTSYKTTPIVLRLRTWKLSILLIYYYNTGRTSGIRIYIVYTYIPEKHLNSDLKPPETSIFLCFPYDFLPIFILKYFDFLYIYFSTIDIYLLRSDTFNTEPLNRTTFFYSYF